MKAKIYLFICVLLCSMNVFSQMHTQTITAYQYYFDTDPGVGNAGNGAVEFISPNSNFDQMINVIVPLNLQNGIHNLYVRVMDEFGKWSLTQHSSMYVYAIDPTQTIAAYQYYFDSDPGIGNAGNGNIVPVSPAANLDQTLAIVIPGTLNPGLHKFYLRMQDQSGRWSLVQSQLLDVKTTSNNQIVAGEYFIDADPGHGNGIPIVVQQPSDSVDLDLNIPIPETFTQCTHKLISRFKSADDRWSIGERLTFKNPHTHARVFFEPVVSANTVYFETDTVHVTNTNWSFGDATTSSVLNPLHVYAQAGSYNVRCIAGNSQCPNDTMIKQVVIAGVRHLECRTGCNNGTVTMNINGGAFTGSTIVKLKKAGFPDIIPTTLQYINNTLLTGKFNLDGTSIGLRDLEVTIPGVGTYTLTDEFEIIGACNDSLQMTYEGSRRYRITGGFTSAQIPAYTRIVNKSAVDALGVMVLWRDGDNISEESISSMSTLSGIPFFTNAFQYFTSNSINTSLMNFHLFDDSTDSRIGGIIIPKIEANSSAMLPLQIIASNLSLNVHATRALLPLLKSDATSSNISKAGSFSLREYLKYGIEKGIDISVDTNLYYPCFNQAYDSLLSVIASNATNGQFISLNASIAAMLVKISLSGCVTNLSGNLSNDQFKKIMIETVGTMAYGADDDSLPTMPQNTTQNRRPNDFGDGVCENAREDFNPLDAPSADSHTLKGIVGSIYHTDVFSGGSSSATYAGGAFNLICMTGSQDPNQKSGPGDNPDKIWLNKKNDRAYTIQFENLASASAPAITVEVTDTLDPVKFDLNSFRWGTITIGNQVIVDLSDIVDKDVIRIIDLPFNSDKVLFIGRYNSESGIISWKMITVDPVNFQTVGGALDGFLPPNTNGEGAGYIGYRINFNSGVQTGDSITNKATIVFDENDPITTNLYLNRYDPVKPQSNINSLPAITTVDTFHVYVSGSDIGSGVLFYEVFVSENDAPYFYYGRTQTSDFEFVGAQNNKYEFYSIAVDNAGNIEDFPSDPGLYPDATTLVACTDTFYADNDGDLFGDPGNYVVDCSKPDGYVLNDKDCNDNNDLQNPNAADVCDNDIDENCNGIIDDGCNMTLHARLFLQGFYIGNGKLAAVSEPLSHPDVCDTVLIKFHDAVNHQEVYSKYAIINVDGNIVVQFPFEARDQLYFIAIHHRNSIETWSATPVLTANLTYYNFTSAKSKAYGDNQMETFDQKGWAFYSGDLNQDGTIDGRDFLLLDTSIQNGEGEYVIGDINGDFSVDGSDFLLLDPNIQAGIGAAIP